MLIGMDIINWPVTARRTGVLYKNIYCAICHGVLDVNDTELPVAVRDNLTDTDLVEFWWMTIHCDNETVKGFTESYTNFTFSSIRPLLDSR